MTTASSFAPTAETAAYGQSLLPQRRFTPGAVGGLAGADNAGPEQAGALSLVYGSFADSDNAQRGFRGFTDAQRSLLDAPGFLRWISFADGSHGYGLGWWRSADDAAAWARGPAHREFVRSQREKPFELSQFAGLWSVHTPGRRSFYCPRCRQQNDASSAACSCGQVLDDGFAPTPRT